MSDDEDRIDAFLNDPPMSVVDRAAIRRLTPDEASAFWTAFVSPVGHHLMKLPNEAWPSLMMSPKFLRYQWYDDWNANRIEPMRSLLQELRDDTAVVYVCWNRRSCIETTNGVLSRNWMNFLYEDEGVLALSKVDACRCIFSNGRFFLA